MMSTPLVCSAALCLAAVNCLALPSPDAPAPAGPAARDLLAAQSPSLRDLDKTYELANGRMLHVEALGGDTLRVRYGAHRERWLRPDGHGRFVSRDGLVALNLELDAAGRPENVSITLPASWR